MRTTSPVTGVVIVILGLALLVVRDALPSWWMGSMLCIASFLLLVWTCVGILKSVPLTENRWRGALALMLTLFVGAQALLPLSGWLLWPMIREEMQPILLIVAPMIVVEGGCILFVMTILKKQRDVLA